MSASAIQPTSLEEAQRTFITACHILHYHKVLDAYGHLSVRHPSKPDIFIMSQFIAPATISSPDDLIEYYVEDARPVDTTARPGYSERCIHSEILKAYPKINAVIHSHSSAVVPFACSGIPLRPIFHMAGFLPEKVPVWDIAEHYKAGDQRNMLVSNVHLGKALAECFMDQRSPENTSVVLMRGHGFTCMAETIQDCVMRAYFTQENAVIQSSALSDRAGALTSNNAGPMEVPEVQYLSAREREGCKDMTLQTCLRPWGLWSKEVARHPLYENKA